MSLKHVPVHNHIAYSSEKSVLNHRRLDCLLSRLFRCRSKKTSKLRVTGLCERNPTVAGEFLAQKAINAENVPIWWRHHVSTFFCIINALFTWYISSSYLTSVSAAKLRWHLLSRNAIQRIQQMLYKSADRILETPSRVSRNTVKSLI